MKDWPKLMCACGHMADGKNNTTICLNCWQTAKLMMTGDGAHDLLAEVATLKAALSSSEARVKELEKELRRVKNDADMDIEARDGLLASSEARRVEAEKETRTHVAAWVSATEALRAEEARRVEVEQKVKARDGEIDAKRIIISALESRLSGALADGDKYCLDILTLTHQLGEAVKALERLRFAVQHFKECSAGTCDSSCKTKARGDMWEALSSLSSGREATPHVCNDGICLVCGRTVTYDNAPAKPLVPCCLCPDNHYPECPRHKEDK